MVASTGCLMDRSLRNMASTPRLHAHAFGDLYVLLGNERVSRLEPFHDLKARITLAPDAHVALYRLAAFHNEYVRGFGRAVVAVDGSRGDHDRSRRNAGEHLALGEHARLQPPAGVAHSDTHFGRARVC